jgi:hypothetical protein
MIKGACLCGRVQYQYAAEIKEVAICHCKQCKLAQGTPFATNAPVDLSNFEWTKGAQNLTSYFSSPNKMRVFCRTCGSPMYSQRTDLPDKIRLRLGSVTEGHIPEPNYQIYCKSVSKWFVVGDQSPQYDENIE